MLNEKFSYELITQDNDARLGKIKTPRGIIDTPVFMPVGTQGTVKATFTDDIKKNKHTNNLRKHLSPIIKTWNRNFKSIRRLTRFYELAVSNFN